ncbi:MAG: DUF790 family protein [Candidatus Bathyarchaeota archaeon]
MPTSLLVTKRSRDKIMPVYAELTTANLEIANLLIDLYSEHIDRKKGILNQAVLELENIGYEYRFVRGLAAILDRRCQLKTKARVNPPDARRRLFQIASEKGMPTTEEDRSAIFSIVSKELNVNAEELNESLYGDLDDEMIVSGFAQTNPMDLLKQYNLSLTQTLLFNASELAFTTSGNWQRIFRQIKWLGLIYTINVSGSEYWVKVDGPNSLFRLTKRYGTSLAKLLPAIFNSTHWRITAKVIGRRDNKRLLDFELDSLRHNRYMKQQVHEESFDSTVEENFATQFKILASDWELIREPGPLPVGRYVMIPDFLLRRDGLEVYLEIVGFWTPEYLEDKIKKLSMVGNVDMIVAVDRRLACEKFLKRNQGLNVLFYKGKVPLQPILAHLKKKIEERVRTKAKILQSRKLNLTTPVAEAKDIANMLNISVEAVKTTIDQIQITGYRRIGDMFVKETLFNAITEALSRRLEKQKLDFMEATELIEALGGRNSSAIIEALGYQIIWHGISPESAEIRKKQNPTDVPL